MKAVVVSWAIGLVASAVVAQDAASCSAHHAAVARRGDAVMGFDHEKTTHHFLLTSDGGVIRVTANDENDRSSQDAIRSHLAHIAEMFAAGNFEAPMSIHGQTPPGVPVMKERKKAIRYTYRETAAGAQITIATKDDGALAAIHDFLRFQIEDHETGDSLEVITP